MYNGDSLWVSSRHAPPRWLVYRSAVRERRWYGEAIGVDHFYAVWFEKVRRADTSYVCGGRYRYRSKIIFPWGWMWEEGRRIKNILTDFFVVFLYVTINTWNDFNTLTLCCQSEKISRIWKKWQRLVFCMLSSSLRAISSSFACSNVQTFKFCVHENLRHFYSFRIEWL